MKRTPLKRKAWMKRGAPLARGGSLRRTTRLAPINRERRAKRYAEAFGARGEPVRAMACLCRDRGGWCFGAIQAAHVVSRGAGGNRRHLVPLCKGHHDEQHAAGVKTFAEKYGLDLHAEAERIAAELDERGID